MGYIDENLLPDERIIWKAKLHWIIFITPSHLLVMLLFLPIGLFMLAGAIFSSEEIVGLLVLALLLFVIGIIPPVASFIQFTTSEFAVTSKRLIAKTGWLRRQSSEIWLEKVEGVSVDQGVIGRMLGFGTVAVTGTGGRTELFRQIADPLGFRQKVHEQTAPSGEPDNG